MRRGRQNYELKVFGCKNVFGDSKKNIGAPKISGRQIVNVFNVTLLDICIMYMDKNGIPTFGQFDSFQCKTWKNVNIFE